MSRGKQAQEAPIEGVIFDMDGLLLDSESLAMESLISAGAALGYDLPMAFCRRMIGMPADACRALVRESYGVDFPLEDFFRAQEQHLREFVDNGRLIVKEGVVPLLDYLDEQHIPRAVATSSSRVRTDHHLRQVGLFDRFDAIVTRDDVTRGKPDAEPYLKASSLIGIEPRLCLALEDSPNGARAAHAAGIRVLVIPDLLEPSDDIREKATEILTDLDAALTFIRHFRD